MKQCTEITGASTARHDEDLSKTETDDSALLTVAVMAKNRAALAKAAGLKFEDKEPAPIVVKEFRVHAST